jgi:threonine/homoserine/homoserine lactone efflux protein
VFGGYAALFSMPSARRIYMRIQRGLDACLALVFGAAGIRLLTSRV